MNDLYQNLRSSFEQAWQDARNEPSTPDDPPGEDWYRLRLEMLVNSQMLWQEYRDTLCQAYAHEYQGGSLAWPVMTSCHIETNEVRLRWLREIYDR